MSARVIPFPDRGAGPAMTAAESPASAGAGSATATSGTGAATGEARHEVDPTRPRVGPSGEEDGYRTPTTFASALEAVLALSVDKLATVRRSATHVFVSCASGAGEFTVDEWDQALEHGRFQ